MKRKIIFRWLKIIILLYCIIGITLYYLQEKFIFHPEKLSNAYVYDFKVPFEELNIPFNATDTLNMIKFFPSDTVRRGVVVYFHGNKENIERYAGFADIFTKQGYEVWMEDYPGFGKSTGERTEQKMYEQGLQVQKMAAAKYGKDSIIIYGRSLGTGIASYLASVKDCRRLILESPYYSMEALFRHYAFIYPVNWMCKYHFSTYQYLQNVDAPVTIFHSTNDEVIPYKQSKRLLKLAKPGAELVTLEKTKHNTVNESPLYHQKLDSVLQH